MQRLGFALGIGILLLVPVVGALGTTPVLTVSKPNATVAATGGFAPQSVRELLDPPGSEGVTVAPAPIGLDIARGMGAPDPSCEAQNPTTPCINFTCPSTANQVSSVGRNDQTDLVIYGCPLRIYDTQHYFGNAHIAVNARDQREVAFFALHGGPREGGPHGYSRDGAQSHVAFTSPDQGLTWADQPIDGGQGYGETATGVMDKDGNLYLGYLWSQPSGNVSLYGSTIGLFKADGVQNDGGVLEGYRNHPKYIQDRTGSNPITTLGMVFVAPYVPPPPVDENATANATGGPSGAGDIGKEASPTYNTTDERVVATWFERAADEDARDDTGMWGWIDAAVTGTGSRNNWTTLPDAKPGKGRSELIGPCLDASNPVTYEGKVYIACTVEKGYNARRGANIGDVDIWSINPLTLETKFVGFTKITSGGHPFLAASPDGYFMLLTTRFTEDLQPEVRVASGYYGSQWHNVGEFGTTLKGIIGGTTPLRSAGVTALALSERDNTAVLIYKEWAPTVQEGAPVIPDPLNPGQVQPQLKDFTKAMIVLNECDGVTAAAKMQLGTGVDVYNLAAYAEQPAIFDDVQDGLTWVKGVDGAELFYFAVNDYGGIQYGALTPGANAQSCTPPPPAPPLAAAPIAQALAVGTGANVYVAASVAVVSLAMITYLLTVKRKAPSYTTAEDK